MGFRELSARLAVDVAPHILAPRDARPPCRICGGVVFDVFDFGNQPVSNGFVRPDEAGTETFFPLILGRCYSCAMVQQRVEVARSKMFHADYPFRTSSSRSMSEHFAEVGEWLVGTELTAPDAFLVEIGCNDGVLLDTVRGHGVRHLGVDPSTKASQVAMSKGVRVLVDFFEESTAATISQSHGCADVIYAANTLSHIPYIGSIFAGVRRLLADDGVFVFEDRYLADILENTYFDQIYDEHFYLFSVQAVERMVRRYGLELVDVVWTPHHGGSVRYTVARPGRRPVQPAVLAMIGQEQERGLNEASTFDKFGDAITATRDKLVSLLLDLRAVGQRIIGYGATSKSATVANYCNLGSEIIPFVCDSTPEKQGLLTPGTHIPIRPPRAFADPYPDYALLFAWNHAEEIMAKEKQFRAQGGRWILYVPHVHIV
ncbi:methyltransferase domain-containing protein [Kibdelosporangium aridum]|uniref:methyltransferase domain-containing protein n=1 Tax=Kibdelosporangium aridum TaxID=2030 RepID=UPI000A6A556C